MRDNHDEVHDVVLKVATISSGHLLLNEAHFYEDELLGLQGDAVPRCFGFFQGDLGLIKISCLILEDCGSVMEGSLYDVDIATKLKLVEKLDKIHTAGVIHQDLAARHIVMKDNEPYWIDFGEAARHSCRKRMEVTPGDFSPDLHEFGCTEIYEFVERLDLWKSIYVHYQNNVFFLDLVESPEYLYHSLHPAQIETEEQQDQAWREAEETYRFIAEDRKLWIARYGQTQGCQ
ncbi:hypothetical protein JAAARDRAFT_162994 [Jaapia argillacea MUCL 33604]|uniref:Non-specific serine/threonine protein kinase n=1 Tax=Jaapia argillacea MUCL 33604 TaxID=933084 RepID=A0A067PBF1_9AGAM|nr:hypothetical protein JAAARDRAFT_162994 [Jaapia argillacea MUCL 33604]